MKSFDEYWEDKLNKAGVKFGGTIGDFVRLICQETWKDAQAEVRKGKKLMRCSDYSFCDRPDCPHYAPHEPVIQWNRQRDINCYDEWVTCKNLNGKVKCCSE